MKVQKNMLQMHFEQLQKSNSKIKKINQKKLVTDLIAQKEEFDDTDEN